jgi:hypothetical protein
MAPRRIWRASSAVVNGRFSVATREQLDGFGRLGWNVCVSQIAFGVGRAGYAR